MRLIQWQCTPALSPRRGRNIRPWFDITTELGWRVLQNERQRSGDCNRNVRIFQRCPSALPLLEGEGWGEGEQDNRSLSRPRFRPGA